MDTTSLAILATIAMPLVAILAIIVDRARHSRAEAKEDGATNTELKHLIQLIGEVRTDVKNVPALVRDVEWLKESVAEQTRRLTSHIHSDHRELDRVVDKLRDSIHEE